MELRDVLNLALNREQATIELYTDLLETCQKLGGLEKRIKDSLAVVDHALRKFEEGTYGLCDVCGKQIDPDRLEALPQATLCLNCKANQAKNAKAKSPPG